MIQRKIHLDKLIERLANFPIVAILGPRQVGKTTLARQLVAQWPGKVKHFDLEDPEQGAVPKKLQHPCKDPV